MMEKENILKIQNEIDEEIKSLYKVPALDGISDIDLYLKRNGKILWVLKETGSVTGATGAFDNRKKVSNMQKGEYTHWKCTYGNVARVSYGITLFMEQLVKDISFKDLPQLNDDGGIGQGSNYSYPLQEIAWINVKKESKFIQDENQNTTNKRDIEVEYAKPEVKHILKKQLNYIGPNIVIFGCDLIPIVEDFAEVPFSIFKDINDKKIGKFYYDNKRKILFINTYHPNCGRSGIRSEDYCNSIFEIVVDIFK